MACPFMSRSLCDIFLFRRRVVEKFCVVFEVMNDFRDGTVTRDVCCCPEAILCQVECDDQTLHRRVEFEDRAEQSERCHDGPAWYTWCCNHRHTECEDEWKHDGVG